MCHLLQGQQGPWFLAMLPLLSMTNTQTENLLWDHKGVTIIQIDLTARIPNFMVMLWTSATNFMDILQVIRMSGGPSSATQHRAYTLDHIYDSKKDSVESVDEFVQRPRPDQHDKLTSLLTPWVDNTNSSSLNVSTSNCHTCICFSTIITSSMVSVQLWIVDSGATRHICSQANLFVTLDPIDHTTVHFPDNS